MDARGSEAPRPKGGASRQGWFGGLTMTNQDSSLSFRRRACPELVEGRAL